MRWFALISLILAGAFAGCQKDTPPAAPPTTASANSPGRPAGPSDPTNAQPKLKTIRLWLGTAEVQAELALSFDQVRTGLMYRTNMAEDAGMLFVFARPQQASFYMRHTLIPLSVAYINADGDIVEINDMKPLDETPIVAASDDVQYALEMNKGWFERHKISSGTLVRTEFGSLAETFFSRRQ